MDRLDNCLYCDVGMDHRSQGRPRRFHEDLCRRAGGRFLKKWKPFVVLVFDAIENKAPSPKMKGWGLLRELVQDELDRRGIEIRHRRRET